MSSYHDNLSPRPLSRLTYKIMGINLLAVAILVMGLLYLDQFREKITETELQLLSTETRLYGSLLNDEKYRSDFSSQTAKSLIQNLTTQEFQTLYIFDIQGHLLVEVNSRVQKLPEKKITDNENSANWFGRNLEKTFVSLTDFISPKFQLPPYPDLQEKHARFFPDAEDALAGDQSLSAWSDPNGQLILSSSFPLIDPKTNEVIAALLVTRHNQSITDTFTSMRLAILRMFLISLLITAVFSLYLAAQIGHPLRRLAYMVDLVRNNQATTADLPDYSLRKDEIGELSVALREMSVALEQRYQAIDKFAADVAHELKNPLSSLKSALETLDRIENPEDKKRLATIMRQDLNRMDRLITDISKASRLDSELSRDIAEKIDIGQLIKKIIERFERTLQQDLNSKSILFKCIGFEEPCFVIGTSIRLEQVFENIISNAVSFSPSPAMISIFLKSDKKQVLIQIQDQGKGISENTAEKIFERFYTDRSEQKSFGLHSGLGLSIAKQIIEAHDGTIRAFNHQTQDGKILGAVFEISLPAAGR
jgi:two-component system, OmpR family, sensor histidine kinase ChvG